LFVILAFAPFVFSYDFDKFVKKYNKVYGTGLEHTKRKAIFETNLKFVRSHNRNVTKRFRVAVNKFADLTSKEFAAVFLKYKTPANRASLPVATAAEGFQAPKAVDWRTSGIVGPIKDQGQCGSCWAFSTVASVEAVNARKSKSYVALSEQQLVDCDTNDYGCDGGFINLGLQYVTQNGVVNGTAYPYTGVQGQCKTPLTATKYKLSTWAAVSSSETALLNAAAQGVVSVAIDAGQPSFQFYHSGVYSDPRCTTELNHAVNVVGYGTTKGRSSWIVRNSWGKNWGMGGYMLMARGVNMCGIANDAYYASA